MVVARTLPAHTSLVDAAVRARRAPAVPGDRGRRAGLRRHRDRRDRAPSARPHPHGGARGRPRCGHALPAARALPRAHRARMPPGNRAHPPDPRAHGAPQASDRRRSGVWRFAEAAQGRDPGTDRGAARLQAPGTACRNAGIQASGEGRAGALHARRCPTTCSSCCDALREDAAARTPGADAPADMPAQPAATPTGLRRSAPSACVAFTTLRPGAGGIRARRSTLSTSASRSGDDADAVADEPPRLVERFALPSPPRWLRQVHGTRVAVAPGRRRARSRRRGHCARPASCSRSSPPIACRWCSPPAMAAKCRRARRLARTGGGVLEATLPRCRRRRMPSRLARPCRGSRCLRSRRGSLRRAFVDRDPRAASHSRRRGPAIGGSTSTRSRGNGWPMPASPACPAAGCARSPIHDASIRIAATSAPGAWRRSSGAS